MGCPAGLICSLFRFTEFGPNLNELLRRPPVQMSNPRGQDPNCFPGPMGFSPGCLMSLAIGTDDNDNDDDGDDDNDDDDGDDSDSGGSEQSRSLDFWIDPSPTSPETNHQEFLPDQRSI